MFKMYTKCSTVADLIQHSKSHELRVQPSDSDGSGSQNSQDQQSNSENSDDEQSQGAIGNSISEKEYQPSDDVEKIDSLQLYSNKKSAIMDQIISFAEENRGVKWYLSTGIRFVKINKEGEEDHSVAFFTSRCSVFYQQGDEDDMEQDIDAAFMKMHSDQESYQREGLVMP